MEDEGVLEQQGQDEAKEFQVALSWVLQEAREEQEEAFQVALNQVVLQEAKEEQEDFQVGVKEEQSLDEEMEPYYLKLPANSVED